jgi:hypothetical protein
MVVEKEHVTPTHPFEEMERIQKLIHATVAAGKVDANVLDGHLTEVRKIARRRIIDATRLQEWSSAYLRHCYTLESETIKLQTQCLSSVTCPNDLKSLSTCYLERHLLAPATRQVIVIADGLINIHDDAVHAAIGDNPVSDRQQGRPIVAQQQVGIISRGHGEDASAAAAGNDSVEATPPTKQPDVQPATIGDLSSNINGGLSIIVTEPHNCQDTDRTQLPTVIAGSPGINDGPNNTSPAAHGEDVGQSFGRDDHAPRNDTRTLSGCSDTNEPTTTSPANGQTEQFVEEPAFISEIIQVIPVGTRETRHLCYAREYCLMPIGMDAYRGCACSLCGNWTHQACKAWGRGSHDVECPSCYQSQIGKRTWNPNKETTRIKLKQKWENMTPALCPEGLAYFDYSQTAHASEVAMYNCSIYKLHQASIDSFTVFVDANKHIQKYREGVTDLQLRLIDKCKSARLSNELSGHTRQNLRRKTTAVNTKQQNQDKTKSLATCKRRKSSRGSTPHVASGARNAILPKNEQVVSPLRLIAIFKPNRGMPFTLIQSEPTEEGQEKDNDKSTTVLFDYQEVAGQTLDNRMFVRTTLQQPLMWTEDEVLDPELEMHSIDDKCDTWTIDSYNLLCLLATLLHRLTCKDAQTLTRIVDSCSPLFNETMFPIEIKATEEQPDPMPPVTYRQFLLSIISAHTNTQH